MSWSKQKRSGRGKMHVKLILHFRSGARGELDRFSSADGNGAIIGLVEMSIDWSWDLLA